MAPSTRGRSRKSSAEDISPPVDPITPVVEQPTPVVPVVEGSSSTLSEGINQPTDSEEVSDDVSYDEDSPSSDESDSSVTNIMEKEKRARMIMHLSLLIDLVVLIEEIILELLRVSVQKGISKKNLSINLRKTNKTNQTIKIKGNVQFVISLDIKLKHVGLKRN